MQRRKFIAGLGSLAAAGAAGIGTGAFNSVQANRSVSVSVASDADALLALTPDPDGDDTNESENADYLSWSNGQVSINIDGTGTTGSGVNPDATTQITDLFKVENQGTQAAVVYVDPDSISDSNYTWGSGASGIMIDPQASNRPNGDYTPPSGLSAGVEDDQISLTGNSDGPDYSAYDNGSPGGAAEEFVLEPGEFFDFGLYVKTDDTVTSSTTISETIEIRADATLVPDNYYGDNS